MKRIIWFLMILMAVSFSSCKKSKENNILGNWQKISFTQAPDSITIIWKFDENKTVRGSRLIHSVEDPESVVTSNYSIKFKGGRYVLSIDRDIPFIINNFDYRGIYAFLQLDREVLQIMRLEGFHFDAVTGTSVWSKGGNVYLIADFIRY